MDLITFMYTQLGLKYELKGKWPFSLTKISTSSPLESRVVIKVSLLEFFFGG